MVDNKIIQEWLDYAASDLLAARHMFENVHPKQTEISVFHCQQCAEKALKAYLVAHDVDPPKIHNLLILCKMCREFDSEFQSLDFISRDLNRYAVASRYPKQTVSDEAEVRIAIDKAQAVYDFCVTKIGLTSGKDNG